MVSADGVGVTVGALLTGVTDAGVVQLAEQTCAAVRTLAVERSDSVMAGGAVVAGGAGAVVDVVAAVVARPAVHTDALVAAEGVVACAAILAGVGHQLAFVDVLRAELTCEFRFALAVVGVDSVHTRPSILALVTRTVVDVVVAVFSCKTWHTGALVAGVSLLDAGSSVVAGRRVAGQVAALAVFPHELRRTLTSEAAHLVDAHAAISAGRRVRFALVDVLFAGFSAEERRAGADVAGLNGGTLAAVGTRV